MSRVVVVCGGRSLESRRREALIVEKNGVSKTRRIDHSGDVLVTADVEKGTYIRASGDVWVWGSIKGTVHAGYPNKIATVHARRLHPHATILIGDDDRSHKRGSPRLHLYESDEMHARLVKAGTITGIYAVAAGAALMMFPLTLYGYLFDATKASSGLVRLGGCGLIVFGLQYLGASVEQSSTLHLPWLLGSFFGASVVSRLFLATIVVSLVLLRSLEIGWLLFAVVNAIGAIVTLTARKNV